MNDKLIAKKRRKRKQRKQQQNRKTKRETQTLGDFIVGGIGIAIVFLVGVAMIIVALLMGRGYIQSLNEIKQYTENAYVVEGEVRVVYSRLVDNDHAKFFSPDYYIYSGNIVYKNEQGEEVWFVSPEYKEKLRHEQKVKVIYNPDIPDSMDIACFNLAAMRYIPKSMNLSIMSFVIVIGLGIFGVLFVLVAIDFIREKPLPIVKNEKEK